MTTVTHLAAHPGRLPEFFLTIVGVMLGLGGYALVPLGVDGTLPDNILIVAAIFAAASFVAHLVIRWTAPYADPVIFPSALVLNGIGLAIIGRIDLDKGTSHMESQGMFTLLGVAAAV